MARDKLRRIYAEIFLHTEAPKDELLEALPFYLSIAMYLFFMTWFKASDRVAGKEFLMVMTKVVVKEISGLSVSKVFIEKQFKDYLKLNILKEEKEVQMKRVLQLPQA